MSKLSHVRGVLSPPLLETTIGAALETAARRWGDRLALVSVHQGISWSYAELHHRAEAMGAGLLALGLEPGDRIGIWAPNSAEWMLTQYAAAKAGLILVNVNPAYRVRELEYALNTAGCKALVTATRFKSSDYLDMLSQLAPELNDARPGHLAAARLPTLHTIVSLEPCRLAGVMSFQQLPQYATDALRNRLSALGKRLSARDPINIQFTSGTTGAPKGATLTHHNVLNNGFLVGEQMQITEEDRIGVPVPLYHCFGMVMGNLNCVTHGAAAIFPSAGFEPLAVLQAVHSHRCTALYGVPTMFAAILNHPDFDRFDLSSLRTGIMAGSPCPEQLMKQVIEQMHLRDITICYGMTETSPVSFQTHCKDPIDKRVSTVGTVHPHVEVKIVDEKGDMVPTGTAGELCTRGYSVMHGYWQDAQRTQEAIDEGGWMHTGDLAVIDADGYCQIVGRIKDMVIRGGENIYPREIEEFLYRHPKIQAVSCFGVPDARYGEVLCAWVQLKPGSEATADEVLAFCRGQIAHYKVPQLVRFVSEFPMTVTGKIQKFVMRDRMVAELSLSTDSQAHSRVRPP